mmetsp:Transcript_28385/g.91405  ORF Transcript_28385/g.91405 Transcript_28385/m.91405 type:complete len:210 (+) Transcript_28385:642-1271(+)
MCNHVVHAGAHALLEAHVPQRARIRPPGHHELVHRRVHLVGGRPDGDSSPADLQGLPGQGTSHVHAFDLFGRLDLGGVNVRMPRHAHTLLPRAAQLFECYVVGPENVSRNIPDRAHVASSDRLTLPSRGAAREALQLPTPSLPLPAQAAADQGRERHSSRQKASRGQPRRRRRLRRRRRRRHQVRGEVRDSCSRRRSQSTLRCVVQSGF